MRTTVDYRDGWLCVRWEEASFSQPENIITYWPVRKVPRSDVEDIIGRPAWKYGHPGAYYTTPRDGLGTYRIELPLIDGGKTTPIKTVFTPLPCPRVRKGTETRYRAGQWEKYLKTRGWVPA